MRESGNGDLHPPHGHRVSYLEDKLNPLPSDFALASSSDVSVSLVSVTSYVVSLPEGVQGVVLGGSSRRCGPSAPAV